VHDIHPGFGQLAGGDAFPLLQQRQQQLLLGHEAVAGVVGQVDGHRQHAVRARRDGRPLADHIIARAHLAPDQVAKLAGLDPRLDQHPRRGAAGRLSQPIEEVLGADIVVP